MRVEALEVQVAGGPAGCALGAVGDGGARPDGLFAGGGGPGEPAHGDGCLWDRALEEDRRYADCGFLFASMGRKPYN